MAAISVSLQPAKRIDRLRRHPRALIKDLERFLGLALWACNLFPVMKSQLHFLYKLFFSPGASHFSVGPNHWLEVKDCLRQDLRFFRTPPGTAIPVDSKLLSIRHKELASLADLDKIFVQDKRLWLRVVNPKSSRRRLSKDPLRVLLNFQEWLQWAPPFRVMHWVPVVRMQALADASAAGSSTTLQGFVQHPGFGELWFSEQFSFSDFVDLGIPVNENMSKDIACFEALAQGALIFSASALRPACRVRVILKSLSGNTAHRCGSGP